MRPQFQLTFAVPFGGIRIDGDLDLSTGDAVLAAFDSLEVCGVSRIQVDLAGITFIDAYSLGLLRDIQLRLAAHGGCLEVVAASEIYVRVCGLAGYDTLMPTDDPQCGTATTAGAASAPAHSRR